ncbi:hypothetical protein LWI29_028781 [Acer saccharum]|uniref:Uncharacterized protein n=1 Tax=Acer saccharum TaxID=4024 RepID=A0AA39TE19_ACESA|nr:hypothetical protein LWI29_028781 [Acer saccharum]
MGHKKSTQLTTTTITKAMERDIEDFEVLKSLHNEVMELENSTGGDCISTDVGNSTSEQVNVADAINFEVVTSKLKEAMERGLGSSTSMLSRLVGADKSDPYGKEEARMAVA